MDPVALAASTDEPEAAAAQGQDEEGRITIVDMPGTSGKQSRVKVAVANVAPLFAWVHSGKARQLITSTYQLPSAALPTLCSPLTAAAGHPWLATPSACLLMLGSPSHPAGRSLLDIRDLTLRVPSSGATLVQDLSLSVTPGEAGDQLPGLHG